MAIGMKCLLDGVRDKTSRSIKMMKEIGNAFTSVKRCAKSMRML